MPVTARLSRRFYEKLGDEVTNELVDWLNAVDQSYREEFRELFDANFSRLDARLAQQAAELRARLDTGMAQLSGEFQARMAQQSAEFQARMAQQAAELRGEFAAGFAALEVRIAASEKSLIRWMFTFWIGSWAAILGMVVALRQIGWLGAP